MRDRSLPIRLATIVLALAGCAPAEMPRQSEAVRLVWVDTYGQRAGAPIVRWLSDCDHLGTPGVIMPRTGPDAAEGQCVASYYEPDDYRATVAWHGDYSSSGFAQELANAVLCETRCTPVQDTPFLEQVAQANAALTHHGF